MHGRHLREEAALAAVGALVEHEPAAAGHELAVLAGACLELDHHALAPVPDREELLRPREDELDRPSGGAGERGDVTLEMEVALGSETAAEERNDHAHVRLRDLQHVRHSGACGIGHLCRRPHGDAVSLPLGDDRTRLDRDSLHRVGDEAALDDDVRARHGSIGVALHDRRVAESVALCAAEFLGGSVRLPLGVDERGVVSQSRRRSRGRGSGS